MKRIRCFTASVTYRENDGTDKEENFPVYVADYPTATSVALNYVLQILRLEDFELRVVGA
jgi:hypothetical protein